MSLDKYQSKRKFEKTPEPKGKADLPLKKGAEGKSQPIFVVQKHDASRLHFDFRLEINGVLKSWAVPKGVSEKFDEKRLAVMTEDHPLEYADFEGTIPQGNYGAGQVEIWDKGTYEMTEVTEKAFVFILHGKKLQGKYVLFNFKDKNWFLFKTKS